MSSPQLSWELVKDKGMVEFGAHHDSYSWRIHLPQWRFNSLHNAFHSPTDSIPLLLTAGNKVSNDNPNWGKARFAAVWYDDEDWAILCNADGAVLVDAESIRSLDKKKGADPDRRLYLESLFKSAPTELRRSLSDVPV